MKRCKQIFILTLLAATPWACAFAQGTCKVDLTQEPLVMRLGSDEFRIAFGLDGASCLGAGCNGEIRYKATWEGQDGTRKSEQKSVHFDIPSGAPRSLAIDRSYFDDGEGRQTTKVVGVEVDRISCTDHAVAALVKH